MRFVRLPTLALPLLLAACGGKVFVDNEGAGGAGTTSGAGGSGGGEYSAFALPTDVPRYVIFKRENDQNRCVFLTAAMGLTGQYPGIQVTMDWSVELARVTPQASDCGLGHDGVPNPATSVAASEGGGDVKQDSTTFPTTVSAHVKLAFPPDAPWVPAGDTFDVDNLPVLIQAAGP